MTAEVERFISNCSRCLPYKTRKDLPPGLLQPLSIPDRLNQHLTINFKELPKDKEGYDYILIIVDRFCKDFEAIPCHKTTKATAVTPPGISHITNPLPILYIRASGGHTGRKGK